MGLKGKSLQTRFSKTCKKRKQTEDSTLLAWGRLNQLQKEGAHHERI